MAELALDCSACGKKFRVSFAVKPKQVACPQCKARVNTSAEQPAPAAAAPATPAPVGDSAAQPKPRRLSALLKPEDIEFQGWTYDREAEQARGGLQKADVMGVVWIGGVLLMIGFILFRLLKSKIVGEGFMSLGGVGLLAAGYLFWMLKQKPDASTCAQCHGALGLQHTIPTARDCTANNYLRGASGHAYRLENGPTRKIWEIHKKWHVCKACKRYFLAEKESLDFVGATQDDMEKREALYAAAAAAVAVTPQPAPAAAAVTEAKPTAG